MKTMAIIAVTYLQFESGQLPRFIACLLNQTSKDYHCQIWNDGPSTDGTKEYMEGIVRILPENFSYHESVERENCYGHTNRSRGLALVKEKYVNFQNCDNTMVPEFVEKILANVGENEVLTWVIRHSYFQHRPFFVCFDGEQCDMCQFVTLTEVAKRTGFNHKDFAADAWFIREIRRDNPNLKYGHINNLLGDHN